MQTTILATLMPETPTFLDDFTPDSGLALRRWTIEEYYRMAYPVIFGPEERLELIYGELIERDEGIPRLFTIDEYYRLSKYGILKPDERTELIYGRVIQMSPMGEPHNICVMKTEEKVRNAFGWGFVVRTQMPIRLSSGLEPIPDIAIVPGKLDDYDTVPAASKVIFLVEVSNSTLRYDRHGKATMYATDAIPEYWVINLRQRTLEVRRDPQDTEYQSLETFAEGESVAPLAAPSSFIAVSDLLPIKKTP